MTAKGNWIVGAQAFSGNPYDGHTLKASLEQTDRLTNIKVSQNYLGITPQTFFLLQSYEFLFHLTTQEYRL